MTGSGSVGLSVAFGPVCCSTSQVRIPHRPVSFYHLILLIYQSPSKAIIAPYTLKPNYRKYQKHWHLTALIINQCKKNASDIIAFQHKRMVKLTFIRMGPLKGERQWYHGSVRGGDLGGGVRERGRKWRGWWWWLIALHNVR